MSRYPRQDCLERISLMKDFRALHRKAPSLAPQMSIVHRPVDMIIRPWQAPIGGNANHAARGCSFDDHARKVEAANAA